MISARQQLRGLLPLRMKTRYKKLLKRRYSSSGRLRRRLDHHLITRYGRRTSSRMEITRTPITGFGSATLFVNDLELAPSGVPRVRLVEKAIWRSSTEAEFWNTAKAGGYQLAGEGYAAVEPVHIVEHRAATVIYLPYVAALSRSRDTLSSGFQQNLADIISATGRLNGNNPVRPANWISSRDGRFRLSSKRPTVADLEWRLDVSPSAAVELQRAWDEVRRNWPTIVTAYERLPTFLCHNDIAPGNAIWDDGITRFVDFGMAKVGVVGSDLHSIIRCSGMLHSAASRFEELLNTYTESVNSCGESVAVNDVRLGAWTTFYLRYSNLGWTSSRDYDVYWLALRTMKDLIRDVGATRE